MSMIVIFLGGMSIQAQDQIHRKNLEVISCKVKEIGMDEIKFTLPNYGDDVLFSVGKDAISKVIFANGEVMEFKDEMSNPDNYIDNHKNAVKVDFLSPLTGNTTLYYERSIRPGRSFEAGLGIVGLGVDAGDRNAGGFFTKFGYKFIKSPDVYMRGMRYSHILKGTYFKPEIIFGYYAYDEYMYYDGYYGYSGGTERQNVINGAIMLNIGKQWIVDNSFLVDFFFGLGYGFASGDYDEGYHYSFVGGIDEMPLSAAAGLKVGWLFK